MKRLLIFVTGLFFFGFAKAQNKYVIKGHIADLEDNTIISLFEDNGNVLSVISSDTVKAGMFTFSGTADQKKGLIVMGRGDGFPSMWLDVWVGPGITVKISGSGKLLKTWNVESTIPEQKELNRYMLASKVYQDQIQMLSAREGGLFQRMDKAEPARRKSIIHEVDSLRAKADSLRILVNKQDLQILGHSAVSSIWIDKLKSLAMDVRYNSKSPFREPVLKLYNKLSPVQKESETGKEIKTYLFPPVVVKTGEPMADTVFHDLNGKEHHLSEYKGKRILLDFWSIGCGPCIESIPELKEISENLKDSLTVISLSVDTKKKIWQEASEQEKISWVNLSDGGGMTGIAARYGVSGIPHYVIISPEGTVLDSWVGYSKGLIGEKLKKLVH